MKVQMKGQMSGLRDGVEWPRPGEVVDLPADEAEMLVSVGMAVLPGDAEPTVAAPEPEDETLEAPEPKQYQPRKKASSRKKATGG